MHLAKKGLEGLLVWQFCRRAHNSSPHKWYCHFRDWHNWYLTLLIKLKLILVNIGTLNYWYWAQFTLTLLKVGISDLQNDWHLEVLMFGIIGINCFWFLELLIFSMSWLMYDMTDFGLFHIWNFWCWTESRIWSDYHHLLLIYDALMFIFAVYIIKSQVLGLQRSFLPKKSKVQLCQDQ